MFFVPSGIAVARTRPASCRRGVAIVATTLPSAAMSRCRRAAARGNGCRAIVTAPFGASRIVPPPSPPRCRRGRASRSGGTDREMPWSPSRRRRRASTARCWQYGCGGAANTKPATAIAEQRLQLLAQCVVICRPRSASHRSTRCAVDARRCPRAGRRARRGIRRARDACTGRPAARRMGPRASRARAPAGARPQPRASLRARRVRAPSRASHSTCVNALEVQNRGRVPRDEVLASRACTRSRYHARR